jgi:hydrogenase maturation protease
MSESIVILGVGNLLMSDDGVGVHAVRELQRGAPAGVTVVDVGTDFLSAIPFLESAERVLVLDAVRGKGRPGDIHQLAQCEIVPRPDGGQAHATSVLEARRLLSPGARWPAITVLGVVPSRLDYGMDLSDPVARALPNLVSRARELVGGWQGSRPALAGGRMDHA